MADCGFDMSWAGRCKKPAGESGRCQEHTGLTCVGCGATAVKSCDHTGIQFVCGANLCAGCMHAPPADGNYGLFMMGGGHKPAEIAREEWAREWASFDAPTKV